MAFREVPVFEVREVLRLWLRGEGLRSVERLAGVDRKTVRRYVTAAEGLGLRRDGGEGQLCDEFMGSVVEAVRPHRSDGHGEAWRLLVARHDRIEAWLKQDGLTVVKVHDLLTREGVVVPERTLHRYAGEVCDVGRGRRGTTVRVNDGEPGDELQVDFGKMGRIPDPETGRQRDCHALIFTPVVSRYSFVWLTHRQTIDDVIAGFEAAWAFYGGVFATVIPDNMKTIVADTSPSLTPTAPATIITPPTLKTPTWSHATGETAVPSHWRATTPCSRSRTRILDIRRGKSQTAEPHRPNDALRSQRVVGWSLRWSGRSGLRPAEAFATLGSWTTARS